MRANLKMRRKTLVSALIVLFVISIIPVLAEDTAEIELTATIVTYLEDVPANTPTTIDASEEAGVILEDFTSTELATVTISLYEENPHPEADVPPDSPMALGIFLEFETTATDFTTEIRVYYTDEEVDVADIEEEDLRLYYFEDPEWTQCANTGVNTLENYVWAVVDHFTIFAPFGAEVTVPAPAPGPVYMGRPNKNPVAEAGLNQTVYVDQIIEFSGVNSSDPDGEIVSYVWDFGDGREASGVNVSHTYSEPGNYTVTLTVRDDRYGEDFDTCTITVRETPTPPPPPPPPPLPPFLDNLNIEPDVVELGGYVTISFDIRNMGSQPIDYGVDIYIENVNVTRIWIQLGAYESLEILYAQLMDTVGEFNVTVHGMTGNFTVEAPEIPLRPAEFEVTDMVITPEEVEPGDEVTISVLVTNIGEETGDYTVTIDYEGVPAGPYLRIQETVSLEGGESERVEFEVSRNIEGIYAVKVNGLTGSFTVEAPPKPSEFVFSDLRIFYPGVMPMEVESGQTVTVTVSIEAENVGELMGDHALELKVNEYVVDSQEVTLEGGESVTVLFELTRGEGTYQVVVEGITASFTIDLAEEPPFWMGPGYVAGILIVVIAAAVLMYAVWKGYLPSTSSFEIDDEI